MHMKFHSAAMRLAMPMAIVLTGVGLAGCSSHPAARKPNDSVAKANGGGATLAALPKASLGGSGAGYRFVISGSGSGSKALGSRSVTAAAVDVQFVCKGSGAASFGLSKLFETNSCSGAPNIYRSALPAGAFQFRVTTAATTHWSIYVTQPK
jgi:hypothetical protein